MNGGGGLREEVGVKEFQEKAGEELIKVGWTRGTNGGGTVNKDSGCPPSGEREKENLRWDDCIKRELAEREWRMIERDVGVEMAVKWD